MVYHGAVTMKGGAELPFELYPGDVPRAIEDFIKLVKEGYYDGKTFHHAIKDFVPQDDCLYGTGAGDLGYMIPCETVNNPHEHEDGSLPMAHHGKDAGYYQFFICYCPQLHLDRVHTVFGKMADSLDVVRDMRNGDVMEKVVIEEV